MAGVRLLDLSGSNPTTAGFAYPHRQIAAAIGGSSDFAYDPQPSGLRTARQAIASYLESRSISISPDRLLLTASSSEAYAFLFKLLCNPGDEILVPVPSYPLFEHLASLENVCLVPYRLRYDGGWHIDFASLETAASERSRVIVVVNPNNPTGSFLKQGEAAQLFQFARKQNLPVISDEVFLEYGIQPAEHAVLSLIGQTGALTFSLNGLSKGLGMPQMKLGWIAVSGPEEQARAALGHLELIADTYLSVNTPVQLALPALFEAGKLLREQIQTRVRSNLETLQSELASSAANPLYTEAGWSAIIRLPRTRREEEWLYDLLRNEHVIVQPGYFFDMESEAYVVASLITADQEFREGIARLRRVVNRG